MIRKNLFIITSGLFLLLMSSMSAYSCVGRILTISLNNYLDQQIIGQILAVYITERTGTTIEFIEAADVQGCRQNMEKEDADIFINYLGTALASMEDKNIGGNSQEDYAIVKEYYMQQFNMVWLNPFGYMGPVTKADSAGGQEKTIAAPVTTKKVLERFPILDRLINKLKGKIDDNTMQELIKKAETMEPEAVAKEFLKSRNMI